MDKYYADLSELILKNEEAQSYYQSLSYDEVQAAINKKGDIHTLEDLKAAVSSFSGPGHRNAGANV